MTELTLAQQRTAIGAGVSNSRVARGGDERRAVGKRIEAERRGESVVEDLNRLIAPARQRRTLRAVQPVGALPVTRGRGNYVPPPATNTGGGIASPLTETNYALREFYDARYLQSSDGVFVWEFLPVKKIVQRDDNDAEVVQVFAEPV